MDKELNFFEEYVHSFDMTNRKIEHKYHHTLRVVEYAKEIAKSLNLDEKEYNRACVCALFHDLGRFPQVRDYDTFIDKESIDHGDKSYEVLIENNYNDDIVLKAVKYHNKKVVPKFDELTDMHCKLVRDADKLDILVYFNNPIDEEILIPEGVLKYFKNHELVDNSFAETKTLHSLRELSFVFDINYKKSMEIIVEKDLINTKLNLIRTEKTKNDVEFIEKEVKNYIKERFDIIC